MFKNKFNAFYTLLNYFIRIFIFAMSTLMLFRIVFLFVYGNKADLSGRTLEILLAFFVGLRFDTTVTAYGMLLPFLLMLSIFIVPLKHTLYYNFVKKFIFYYSLLMVFSFIIISLIDFYFFKFFQFHINILFFGIIYDDTLAVLKSVWTDYPIMGILIFMLGSMSLILYILKKLFRKIYFNPINNPFLKFIIVIILLVLYGIGMRGSLGVFPLQNKNAFISDNTFINTLTVNGLFSLKTAITELNKQNIDTDIQNKLKENGFDSIEDALSIYLDQNVSAIPNIEQLLITNTKRDTFLLKNPPNVIFIQMESFSNYYLDFNSPSMNLLGELENQLKDCILFRNFFPGTSGSTINALEGLMVNSPLNPLSQSIYQNSSLTSSVALPYKNAGYHTNFITGSKLGWHNLDKFIPHQYFETLEGDEALLKNVKNSSGCEWGVFDEFLFERIFQILEQANDKPQFVFAMTTTNHTPFSLPDHYNPYPIKILPSIIEVLRTNEDLAIKNFTNYQYANDCLGRFIDMVRNSEFGENTIIAATGDHNTRQLFDFTDKQLLQKFGVPLLLYVPEKYLAHTAIDTSRFGSHKDIFPTLFNLSLSNANYLKSGINLLDTRVPDTNFGIMDNKMAINKDGIVDVSVPLYFKWSSTDSTSLEPTTIEQSPELGNLFKQAKAYKAAMSFYIQTDLIKQKHQPAEH